jgi:hypothetical protein
MMLSSEKQISPKKIRDDVGKLLGSSLSAAEFDELRKELATAGLLIAGKRNTYTVTDLGRQRALRFIGLAELTPRTNWSTVIAKYLFPKAAGLSASAAAKLKDGDRLAAFILKRKYGLAARTGSTVNQVLEAVACQRLGFPKETSLIGLLCAVLSHLIGSERLTKEQLAKQLPLFETGLTATKADAARCKVVRDWLGGVPRSPQGREPQPAEPFDLTAFATTVRA